MASDPTSANTEWSARPGGILVYGATGLTGKLIGQRIKELGLPATLAGRNPSKLNELHETLGLPVEAVDLKDTERLEEVVGRHKVVLHVAGPFSETSEPMVRACVRKQTHYLDVTGETGVMRRVKETHGEAAEKNGVMLMPAVGFDIVPGDCLAAYLHSKLPSATHLHIGTFLRTTTAPVPRVSQGTLLSAVFYIISSGGTIVQDGQLAKEGIAVRRRSLLVNPSAPPVPVISFPVAEAFAAASSTKIPNVVGYVPGPNLFFLPLVFIVLGFFASTWPFRPLLRTFLEWIKLPDKEAESAPGDGVYVAGEAIDKQSGLSVRASAGVTEGYRFTAVSSTEVARRVLNGDFKPGFQTPSSVYGFQLLQDLPETIPLIDLP